MGKQRDERAMSEQGQTCCQIDDQTWGDRMRNLTRKDELSSRRIRSSSEKPPCSWRDELCWWRSLSTRQKHCPSDFQLRSSTAWHSCWTLKPTSYHWHHLFFSAPRGTEA